MTKRPQEHSELVVVITGASSGFGRGSAQALAAAGAKVVLAARRKEVLDQLVREIEVAGGSALAVETDVSEHTQIEALAQSALARYGRIDVWINNVGVGAIGYFWDIPVEDHARVVDVNLKGLIYGMHVALRRFRSQGHGTLINMGSIDSETPLALQNTYAATKAAVLSLSRSVHEELRLAGNENIRIGTILPWAVDTPWWVHAANYSGHAPRMAMMDDPSIVIDAIVNACLDPDEEQTVGWKAKGSAIMHHLAPETSERLSADLSKSQAEKAIEVRPHSGSLHAPMHDGLEISGGIRERMREEDSSH